MRVLWYLESCPSLGIPGVESIDHGPPMHYVRLVVSDSTAVWIRGGGNRQQWQGERETLLVTNKIGHRWKWGQQLWWPLSSRWRCYGAPSCFVFFFFFFKYSFNGLNSILKFFLCIRLTACIFRAIKCNPTMNRKLRMTSTMSNLRRG